MYLVVPIFGRGNELYGYCGFEVSSTYFRLNMPLNEDSGSNTFTILARSAEDRLYSLGGMADDRAYTHFSDSIEGDLESSGSRAFVRYTSGAGRQYIGIERKIYISPNNNDWVTAVMMPLSEYDRELSIHAVGISVLSLIFLAVAISATVLISNVYVKQIHSGLEMVKSRDSGKRAISRR